VLGIERPDGRYLGAPGFQTRVDAGDVLLLYGRQERLNELDQRPAGAEGDRAHAAAVAAQQHDAAEEHSEDARLATARGG
ncbi:MAG TPA: hypothetical protein VNT54_11540, partial [Solirubrobacteraceae bacterium]|nr:hypothetical protein [Solirubrobacteraceae bacterium]